MTKKKSTNKMEILEILEKKKKNTKYKIKLGLH